MGKTILITGAATGFGRSTAFALAHAGHRVIAGVQIWPQVSELNAAARAEGVELEVIKLDLTSEVDRAHAWKSEVDVLVNNAGVMQSGSMADIPMWAVREVFETNVFGALELTQGFLRAMVRRGSGKVVWVSSMVGLIVVPWLGAYCASKHAIEAIAATMKAELEGTGVKVATINPGAFRTGFNDTGVGTQAQWYDPATAVLGQPQLKDALDAQFDPAEMIADMVEVITGDDHPYRTVKPDAVADHLRAAQAAAWEARA